MNFAFEPISGG